MMKNLKRILQEGKEKYRIPRNVRDLIPVHVIWKDGIFKTGDLFHKTYTFSDINYQSASEENKMNMFLKHSSILNSFDNRAVTKITVCNRQMTRHDFEESVLAQLVGDNLDDLRQEYNDLLSELALVDNGIMQEKFITVSVAKRDIKAAREYFVRVDAELKNRFAELGSVCRPLDAVERLRIFHNFYRPGESDQYHFDLNQSARFGHDVRDYICPDSIEKHKNYLKIGNRYARVFFLKDLATFIRDDWVGELTEICKNMMFSIDCVPIPISEASKMLENKALAVDKNISDWQRRQMQNNNITAMIPYDMELQRTQIRELMKDVHDRDQRIFSTMFTLAITADTKEELERQTEAVYSFAQNRMCQITPLTFQQMDGLNTVLPFGVLKVHAFRTLTTESLAIFMPYKVQEIMEKDGIFFGVNAISKNLILCNKRNLLNQSSIILGVPGSGKSMLAKFQMLLLILLTEDDIVTVEPEGDHAALIEAIDTDATVVRIAAGGKDKLNPMYMVDGYGDGNPLVAKSEFVMSLIEQIDEHGVTPQHKSIIDRCIAMVYEDSNASGEVATLTKLREKLLEQPESQAHDVALALELYTTGTLDIFAHESNVDLNKRVLVFDIHRLGEHLKPAGLLVITDTIMNRVALNWKQGKRTHIFIDEFHVVFQNEHSARFFNSAWRQFRKRNACPTAITQNVEYLLNSPEARSLVSNSEFIVMLNQAAPDRETLGEMLKISPEQMSYITNAEAGCGLIKYGGALVPFTNRIPKNTKLYELMTTTPGEGVFAKGQAD